MGDPDVQEDEQGKCRDGSEWNAEFSACVPENPLPFEVVELPATSMLIQWVPALTKWREFGKPVDPGSSRKPPVIAEAAPRPAAIVSI